MQVMDNESRPLESTATRVFVLDDHPVVRRGLRTVIEREPGFEVVGEAGDARTGLASILSCEPDLALVDIRLPHGDGIEVIREVRSRRPEIRCLIVTSFPEQTALYQAVLAGAAGFVAKDCAATTLIERIRQAVECDTRLTHDDVERVSKRTRTTVVNEELLSPLTKQEHHVLNLVTRGLTNGEIAETLGLAEKTVRNYVSNVLAKLGVRNRTEAAATVAQGSAARRTSRGGDRFTSRRHSVARSETNTVHSSR